MTELELWNKRVERWRDTDLTAEEYAAEIGCDVRLLRLAAKGMLQKRWLKQQASNADAIAADLGERFEPREGRSLRDRDTRAIVWSPRSIRSGRGYIWRRLTRRELLKRTIGRIKSTKGQAAA